MSAGIYLHIPFCKSRCSYCDFATDVWRSNDAVERYVNAICAEIEIFQPQINAENADIRNSFIKSASSVSSAVNALNPDTIYFGGGTPSLLKPVQVEKILNSVNSVFSVAKVFS